MLCSKEYWNLDVLSAVQRLHDCCTKCLTCKPTAFWILKCIEVKGITICILFMHSKVSMTIVQNASHVNLLPFGYHWCIDVKDTAKWMLS